MRRQHIQDHPSRDRSNDRGELPPVARDITQKMSSRTRPYGRPPEIPSTMDIKLKDGTVECKRCQTYELSFQCWEIHWRSRLMTGQRTSATYVSLCCSGRRSHSTYLIRTNARSGGPSINLGVDAQILEGGRRGRWRTSGGRTSTIIGARVTS
jgi:hypothetical protein